MPDPLFISSALEETAALLKLAGEGYKARAYARGAERVAALGDQLGTLIGDGSLIEMPDIGRSLAKQISALWHTGSSPLLEHLRAEFPPGSAELSRVPGLTARRIKLLREQLGIRSVAALREACLAQRVRALPGFGPKTEGRLLAAIERYRSAPQMPQRMLLSDALRHARRLERQIVGQQLASAVVLAGEARRCHELVHALDLVIIEPRTSDLDAALSRSPYIIRSGDTLLIEGVPLRLHTCTQPNVGAALLHATGSAAHVSALKAPAHERRLTLQADGLRDANGQLMAASSDERAIYHALGLHYVPPELREEDPARIGPVAHPDLLGEQGARDQSERREEGAARVGLVARAGSRGELGIRDVSLADRDVESSERDELIERRHVRGAVHCHTTYSDGKHSIEEMARAAQALGFEYITITDHSPSAHYAGGVDRDRLLEQWDEIARVQELVDIRILRGTESDILADGSLDYPDDMLERFDVIIASIHGRMRMDRQQMTARLVRAMALPVFKIWGHALGRILLHRDPIDCDVEAILDALAESRGAIEINGDPHRLDLPPEWIPHARARNIPFILSSDAHSTKGLEAVDYALMMARRGALTSADVLNTLPARDFIERVKP